MNKEFIIKMTLIVSKGTGMCSVTSKDSKKVYSAHGPTYSLLSDNEMAKLLVKEAVSDFYEHEIKEVEIIKPKQLTIE